MNIAKLLKALAQAAPRNEIRYSLNGVHLQEKNNEVHLEVTDGKFLIRLTLDANTEGLNVSKGADFVLAGEYLKKACDLFKADSNVELIADVETNKVTITNSKDSVDAELIDGSFPDTNRVIESATTTRKTGHLIGVNLQRLSKLCRALIDIQKAYEIKSEQLAALEIVDTLTPVLFTREVREKGFNMIALLSPCRL